MACAAGRSFQAPQTRRHTSRRGQVTRVMTNISGALARVLSPAWMRRSPCTRNSPMSRTSTTSLSAMCSSGRPVLAACRERRRLPGPGCGDPGRVAGTHYHGNRKCGRPDRRGPVNCAEWRSAYSPPPGRLGLRIHRERQAPNRRSGHLKRAPLPSMTKSMTKLMTKSMAKSRRCGGRTLLPAAGRPTWRARRGPSSKFAWAAFDAPERQVMTACQPSIVMW